MEAELRLQVAVHLPHTRTVSLKTHVGAICLALQTLCLALQPLPGRLEISPGASVHLLRTKTVRSQLPPCDALLVEAELRLQVAVHLLHTTPVRF